jgi:hypothetical protein
MAYNVRLVVAVADLADMSEVQALRSKVQNFLDSEARAALLAFNAEEDIEPFVPEP